MKRLFSNEDIKRVIVGIPNRHRHLRTIIETVEGEQFVFQEATVAGIVRAYTEIKTHPRKIALELVSIRLGTKKPSYADFQLLETERDETLVLDEIDSVLESD